MTIYDLKLKTALAKKIEEWGNENCETDEWGSTGVYVHPEFESQMADAAYAVFQAMYQSQQYGREQGAFD